MNNKGKTAIILIILLLLLSLGASGFYYISFENQKRENMELGGKLSRADEEKKTLEVKLKKLSDEKNTFESQIKENQDLISKLNDKLADEIKAKETLKNEQESLRNKLVELSEDKKTVKEALDAKLKEIADLQSKLDAAILDQAELKQDIEGMVPVRSGAVDLEKIVVATTGPEQVTPEVEATIVAAVKPKAEKVVREEPKAEPKNPALSAEVLLINKEYNFLVLSVGQAEGVKTGDVFEIYRQDVPLGQVRIEKVHERMSAANFLPGLIITQVKEGDAAKRLN